MDQFLKGEDAIAFIHQTLKFGSKLGLHNITELLSRLGNPQDKLRFIHIAGTNGKGSVAAFSASVLKEAGYRVGLFTSPYIFRFEERIRINGEEISETDLAHYTSRVKDAIDQMVADGMTHPTEFEVVTAIGLLYFYEKECDIVVLEVGLGGRLDATNVIRTPEVCVITAMDYDHMEYLGNTLTEITGEKCGILKEGTPVAVYEEQPVEALSTIKKSAQEKSCPLYFPKETALLEESLLGSRFTYGGEEIKISLLGPHQVKNAALSLCVLDILKEKGWKISQEAILRGMKETRHSGRFEVLSENPLFIMDGAHNEAGMKTFRDAVVKHLSDKKKIFIMGMLRDKEYEKSLEIIGGLWDKMYTVTVPNPRTLEAEELAECAKKYGDHVTPMGISHAVLSATFEADENTAVVAFGSLYLLGEIRKAYEKMKEE